MLGAYGCLVRGNTHEMPPLQRNLVMSERQGIEIDYCPKCRGVWLDRGELDKIIERSVSQSPASTPSREADRGYDRDYDRERKRDYDRHDDYDRRRYDDRRGYDEYKEYKHKKKKRPTSFLEDLFEFGD